MSEQSARLIILSFRENTRNPAYVNITNFRTLLAGFFGHSPQNDGIFTLSGSEQLFFTFIFQNIKFFGHIVASRSLLVKQQQKRHCLSVASLPFQVELKKFVIAKIRPRVSLCNVSLRSKKCCDYKIQKFFDFFHFSGSK